MSTTVSASDIDYSLCNWTKSDQFASTVAGNLPRNLHVICLPPGTKELRKAADFNPGSEALSYMATLNTPSFGSEIVVREDWKVRSARGLQQYFQTASGVALNQGRSVWLMVRPLDNSSSRSLSIFSMLTLVNPTSTICHWGVIVSEMSKPRLETFISGTQRTPQEKLGDLHELRNIGGTIHYEQNPYFGKHELRYLGQTGMTDEQLSEYGTLFKGLP
jgi:hypothetical protein